MISRRNFFKAVATFGVGATASGGYALAETFRTKVTAYRLTPPGWTPGLRLKLAVLADLHACKPWMSPERIERIVEETNALEPDAILLLGDYVASLRRGRYAEPVSAETWATALSRLKAPLGVHAVLGNHDWWDEADVQRRRAGPTKAQRALEAAGIPVYENHAVRLEKNGKPFWIAGLGDQWAFWPRREERARMREELRHRRADGYYRGVDDLPATLARITDDAPVILMVHEPDIFPQVPARVALTLAGHTHGGQVRIFGYAPIVPSKFKDRYVYGHIIENDRHLIVSGGLGVTGIPVRFGSPPEIVEVALGAGEDV